MRAVLVSDQPQVSWRSASLLASFFAASAGGMFQSDGEEVSDDALCVEDIVFDII